MHDYLTQGRHSRGGLAPPPVRTVSAIGLGAHRQALHHKSIESDKHNPVESYARRHKRWRLFLLATLTTPKHHRVVILSASNGRP
jgi:hypothetical protein